MIPKLTVTQLMMKIEDVVPKLEGWCDIEKAQHLAALVIALRPKVSVEIGVFGGRSLIPTAMGHSLIGTGYALGIDPWAKSASLDGMDGENKEWWDKLDHEAIYAGFMSASARLRADGFLKVERMTSDEAITHESNGKNSEPATLPFRSRVIPKDIDLLHIDGNHGPQAIKDVDNYATRLRAGGILVMDDCDWAAPAVTQINALGFRHLYDLGTGAVFQK